VVYLDEMTDLARERLVNQELPVFEETPCVAGPALSKRRIALVTTAGLHRSDDKPFTPGVGEYRIIPDTADLDDLVMSHASTNFDRTGFYRDLNVVFPLERLKELADERAIGSVAARHYALMGANLPSVLEPAAKDIAARLRDDGVDGVVLAGV
jgi:D-proline reductase (dithiol) PrdB